MVSGNHTPLLRSITRFFGVGLVTVLPCLRNLSKISYFSAGASFDPFSLSGQTTVPWWLGWSPVNPPRRRPFSHHVSISYG